MNGNGADVEMTVQDGGPLDVAVSEAEHVIKRQKTSAAKTSGTLYKLIHTIEQSIKHISSDASVDPVTAVEDLSRAITALDAVASISSDTKVLHGAVGKLGKIVEKQFSTDIYGALRPVQMDKRTLDRIVAEHLYYEGAFDVADAFAVEAGIADSAALKAPYVAMNAVLEQLKLRNLTPALEWAESNKAALRQHSSSSFSNATNASEGSSLHSLPPSAIEFDLHRLAFLQVLQLSGQQAALTYARSTFPPFQRPFMKEIQHLMGALCLFRRMNTHQPPKGPYAGMFNGNSERLWGQVLLDFQQQCCMLMGQTQNSPLLVTTAAGAAALPTLLKLASVVSKTQPTAAAEATEQGGEMAVEVPLGKEFVFHSIFACPVSREQSSAENPPMRLPCGHCLSKISVLRVAKSAIRSFKCPYCPREATMQQCMELKFPEMK